MTFASRISPANRIRERLDLPELIKTYSTVVPLEIETDSGGYIPRGSLFTFNNENLHQFIAEIVQHSYEETLALIKRQIESGAI
jgi:hypothetical protein